MATQTLDGRLGVVIIPDEKIVEHTKWLVQHQHIRDAEFVTPPEGVHITLYQARDFKDLPVDVAQCIVGTLNKLLKNDLLVFDRVARAPDSEKYMFWHVMPKRSSSHLIAGHHMSLALSGWNQPEHPDDNFVGKLFGTRNVLSSYVPHITLAASNSGFSSFKPFSDEMQGRVERVVLARMGEWGKIEEILF